MKQRILLPALLIPLSALLFPSGVHAAGDTTAAWTFTTGGPVYSSPTCDEGLVYVGSDDGRLYCLDGQSGTAQWSYLTGGLIRCKPAIADSMVYVESDDGFVHACNKKTGTRVWRTFVGNTGDKRVLPDLTTSGGNTWDYMQSSPCIDSGVVYVGSADSCVYAMSSQTGSVLWTARTGNIVRSSPCVVGGKVYVGSWDKYIYAINKTDGSVAWSFNTGGFVPSSPRVSHGTLYCGSRSGYFYALDAALGTLQWSHFYSSSYPFVESSAAIENGVVYVGSSDLCKVFAFDAATGSILWSSTVPGDTWSSPILRAGTLYIGLADYGHSSTTVQKGGALLAINASSGALKWRHNCSTSAFIGGVVSSPTVDRNLIYYGSLDGRVYAVDTAYGQQTSGVSGMNGTPGTFHLRENWPNPFNPSTTIEYRVPATGLTTLRIYDMLGREVATLVDEVQNPGTYRVRFDGRHLSSGMYFDRLTSGKLCQTRSMLLTK